MLISTSKRSSALTHSRSGFCDWPWMQGPRKRNKGSISFTLALGFLTWYEDQSSSVKREAPLILVPAELIRNERTSTYDIRCRDDDITTNLPLQERLKAGFRNCIARK